MNKQNLSRGKRLAKKELKMITGGVKCSFNGYRCYYYGPGCQEKECQPPVPVDPID